LIKFCFEIVKELENIPRSPELKFNLVISSLLLLLLLVELGNVERLVDVSRDGFDLSP